MVTPSWQDGRTGLHFFLVIFSNTATLPNMDNAIRDRIGEIGDFVGIGVGVAAVVAGGRVVIVGAGVFIVVMVWLGKRP
jgi:hypothetical protein